MGGNSREGCYVCPTNTFSLFNPYWDGFRDCFSCPENTISPTGSTSDADCQCHAGIGWHDQEGCTQTGETTGPYNCYQYVTDNQNMCSSDGHCDACKCSCANSYSGCTLIPENAKCKFIVGPCGVGYTGPDGECVPCNATTYKNTNGSGACTTCPVGSSSPPASSECTLCEAGRYAGSGALCARCQLGTFSSKAGQSTCEQCSSAKYTFSDGSTTCHWCAPGKYYQHETALSVYGYFEQHPDETITQEANAICAPCKASTFSPGTPSNATKPWANNTCLDCPANTWNSDESAAGCNQCPLDTVSQHGSASIASCKCVPGHSGGYTRPVVPGGAFMYTRQDLGWEEFASVTTDLFSSGVVISTNNNNVIYFAPDDAPFVGMYYPHNDTYSRINIDAVEYMLEDGLKVSVSAYGLGEYMAQGSGKYSAAVFTPSNANVYFIPFNTAQVGVLDTETNVISVILQPFQSGSDKYSDGVLSKDGSKIYMIPFNAPNIGVVDVNTHAITTISIIATVNKKYFGGVLATNGKIYLVPAFSLRHIGVLDPTAGDTFSEIDISSCLMPASDWDCTFSSAVLGENGMIYFMPRDGNIIGILDPTTHVFSVLMDISTSFSEGQYSWNKYTQGIVVGGNKIYMVPGYADNIGLLTLSLSGNNFEHLGAWVPDNRQWDKYNGGVLLTGKIYMVPHNWFAFDVVDLNLGGCTACAVNTYSAEYGANTCRTCPIHSSSPCPAYSHERRAACGRGGGSRQYCYGPSKYCSYLGCYWAAGKSRCRPGSKHCSYVGCY